VLGLNNKYRTHYCGKINESDINNLVKVAGWVHSVRDHGGIIFIDLRDYTGLVQIVINPKMDFYKTLEHWRLESVICFSGKVIARSESTINPKLSTGAIEIVAEEMEILGESSVLPFQISKDDGAPENLRLKYRFLDLRKEKLHNNILLRSAVISGIRQKMSEMGFFELQTPILTSSSPEGARDYLVPSRLHPGKFYALPQAPQQFKQLFMVAGFDRYFQIAPCFRDEDARADRSPGEFYQLDVEMSFVTQDDVFTSMENLFVDIFNKFGNKKMTEAPFPRIAYRDAMKKFGSDKPDLRNPLEIIDVSHIFENCSFNAFSGTVKSGGVVRAIKVSNISSKPRKFFDDMVKFAQSIGSKGLGYIIWDIDGSEKSPIVKFLTRDEIASLKDFAGINNGDVIFFIADTEQKTCEIAGKVRTELALRLDLIDNTSYKFCWIVDFPMFEKDEETGSIIFSHNPFSMPQGGMEALNEKDPLDILAYQYDIVCNGIELSSGAIRNHKPEIMYKAFEIAGYEKETVDSKFAGMINAFKFGAPPHGGIAPGVDRMVMILADEPNIREIIAFPFNQQAQDLMMAAPSEVTEKQLKELHIKVVIPKTHKQDESK